MALEATLSRIGINKILVTTDFSAESQNALHSAVSLARRYDSTLFVTHVVPNETPMSAGESWPAMIDVARHNAEKNIAKLEETEDLKFVPHEVVLRSGDIWEAISDVLADKDIDLIVMGTHGYGGVRKLFLGSMAEKVIRHARCPVLTVGPHLQLASSERFAQILYASDFSSGSMRALTCALSLAAEDRAELTMLHVVESQPVSELELLEWKFEDREKMRRMVPRDLDLAYRPEIEVEIGTPDVEIVRLANTRKADLIVMGSHPGGTVSTHLPWTTLHQVLQHAQCPVLTVRATV